MSGVVQSRLAFGGYDVIDATTLVPKARTRDDASASLDVMGTEVLKGTGRAQRGSTFEDLPPAERRALLEEAGAQGTVVVHLSVGPRDGISPVRQNEVQIRLGAGESNDVVWITRCSVESGFNPPIDQALARAAECAIKDVIQ